jgi:hypothetical protein
MSKLTQGQRDFEKEFPLYNPLDYCPANENAKTILKAQGYNACINAVKAFIPRIEKRAQIEALKKLREIKHDGWYALDCISWSDVKVEISRLEKELKE